MADTEAPDPIAVLMSAHARTRHFLSVLDEAAAEGVDAGRGIGRDPSFHHTATRGMSSAGSPSEPMNPHETALCWFNDAADKTAEVVERHLFPALLESMAGSDAVCIKDMASFYARRHEDLQRRWKQDIRPLLQLANDTPAPSGGPASATVQTWISDYLALLKYMDGEVLPMAERLLDDASLGRLSKACAQINPP